LALTPAVGSTDRTVTLWDVASRRLVGEPMSHGSIPIMGVGGTVNSVAFSPDGKLLASATNDRTVRLWEVARQQPLGEPLNDHIDSVLGVAFSPNGKVLASAGDDYTVRLWDAGSWRPLGQPWSLYPYVVESVAFSPNGKLLASSGQDSTIWLWDVDFSSLASRLCRLANRNLSAAEWRQYIRPVVPEPYRLTCPDLPPGEGVAAK
jgi:WD40 repeat protein